jgi:hypothetical protein
MSTTFWFHSFSPGRFSTSITIRDQSLEISFCCFEQQQYLTVQQLARLCMSKLDAFAVFAGGGLGATARWGLQQAATSR